MMEISNPELYQKKIQNIKNFEEDKAHSITFSFHGITISFYSDSKKLISEIDTYLPRSWKTNDLAEYKIYHRSLSESVASFEDEGSSDLFLNCESTLQTAVQRDFVASYNVDLKTTHCIFEDCVSDGFYNFFRWFLSERLFSLEKAMLHSSALLGSDGKVRIFLGPSGAGKTTVTELSSPRTILGDDMNLIKFENNKLKCAPGAVGGLYQPQVDLDECFEVAGFYWLIQSDQTYLEDLSLTKQHQALYSSFANIAWSGINEDFISSCWNMSDKILSSYKVQNLYFKKDSSFWNLLK